MTVSPQIIHVLSLAQRGESIWWVPLVDGKGSQSRTVGRAASNYTAQRRGWLDQDFKITAEGEMVLAIHALQEQRAREAGKLRLFLVGTRWERGYRVHGLWRSDYVITPLGPAFQPRRLGVVTLGPPGFWDGVYSWSADDTSLKGTAPTLAKAKHAVEVAAHRAASRKPSRT